ncbi:MAG: IS5 family transposase, partial [Geminicoccaceae bacterium]
YKFHDAHRHHIPKTKYRVRNWPAYNAGLCQRGSITLWLSPDVTDGWKSPKREGRGGEALYLDGAIEAMLTLGAVYHLRLRQTQGFTRSVFDLLGLDLPVASTSTLYRRRKALSIEPRDEDSTEPLDLVLDSTGSKIFGQGEWCRTKHGRKPRSWKKVHIGLDAKSGMIVSHLMTGKDAGDPDQVDALLAQIDSPVGRFMADGAYDGDPVYDAIKRHSPDPAPKVVIPPRKTAVLSNEDEEVQTDRDRHILDLKAKGRMAWQKAHDYGRHSLVETTLGRYKSIIGDRLHARHDDAQPVELAIGIKILNRMTKLAKPVSDKVG